MRGCSLLKKIRAGHLTFLPDPDAFVTWYRENVNATVVGPLASDRGVDVRLHPGMMLWRGCYEAKIALAAAPPWRAPQPAPARRHDPDERRYSSKLF